MKQFNKIQKIRKSGFFIVEFSSIFLIKFLNNLKKLPHFRVKQSFLTPKTELIEKIKLPSSKMA